MEVKKLDFSEISIGDKSTFDEYFRVYQPEASELNFSNLFMWRVFYKTQYTVINNFLCIISTSDEKEPFALIPAGKESDEFFYETVTLLRRYFHRQGWQLVFKSITGGELEYFKRVVKLDYDIISDRDNSDYVYTTQDLINLSGKKYDAKRNHINKFKKLREYEYIPISEEHMDECYRIMSRWCEEKGCDQHKDLYCEKIANSELLKNYRTLGCKGALIKVNGVFEAFTVGEMLNENTVLIHIEKANSKIEGLYPFINQQFCQNEWNGTAYINREQDLGLEGLRKAKLSYHPAKMVNKYTVIVK